MATILEFEERRGLKKKVAKYLEDPSLIAKEGEIAISSIVRAFKVASDEERKRMFLVLSTLAQDELCWILVALIEDPEADDDLKDQAAIYLSVIGAFVSNPQLLTKRLNDLVKGPDKEAKIRAVIAMGWEGNTQSVPILAELLHDKDPEVQEVAVIAMSNLGDSRLFGILTDRLKGASSQQKRAILYNLWRFEGKEEEAMNVYCEALSKEEPGLKSDILTIMSKMDLDSVEDGSLVEQTLRNYLGDPDPQVRLACVKALCEKGSLGIKDAQRLVNDPNMEIKRIALSVLEKRRSQ
ncbi:PBS lyase HEAT domain protein repeat-containing protein [Dissulfuribacter thermophilus]|uniref:PBS lyase HEAT domain protein repeat-containing protein n=1 Tax=Dissulfuribacter thermophilus TaxID=1156395 RepID=A0A1B9F629_9BACT|nr:HEAT repeat domain-containing protein [Dissulfuribacter thermophilus]OCC15376.1 PBS lyase HEAT domain protein repeat-containing protein [Dissulfuribacter thermophilus]